MKKLTTSLIAVALMLVLGQCRKNQTSEITVEGCETDNFITHKTTVVYSERFEAYINDIGEIEDLLAQ